MAIKAAPRRGRAPGLRRGEAAAGWLFTAPVIVILGVFLLIPVLMALWVSVSDWGGRGSPLSGSVSFVGADNFAAVLTDGGLATKDFGTSLRNNAWYVLLVVPLQTALALFLAILVNRAMLRGRGFFRTAYYFPSVTSTVAITVLWMFLFTSSGAVNDVLSWFGINGPNWFNDPRGILHLALGTVGVDAGPAALTQGGTLGVSWWEWLAGPSVAMSAYILMAIFTTSGTFMLIFLAGLQNLGADVDEAAMMDGANGWQRFWRITLPQLRPTLFTVLTLGLIGCWQVFDQIYTGTRGAPSKTTLTPAYLSYQTAFQNQEWGQGAAIAFILFVIIVIFTLLQRWVLRDRPVSKRRIRAYASSSSSSSSSSSKGASSWGGSRRSS
ncbi:carbohydrate ABC transporter permease [Microbacterium sp.]|uniref:carbohydrate ABC transporter permease n=1 Tax=Microbacterium sp. TaxID=51671 RepID=UPI00262B63D6|nr:sugar ABC transporter permease [Microbacterium sp.]MCV0376650.1 sugar ABC transporter permease [Microbacterium sp.]MCV0391399.1 sugar ABC transporter permease [Microbacterium sp.]MCV0420005.1 sugar ABC transporter permease [Microbacterium sp.]MCV0423824.1 sugar ABC transporter permease [Microbacterium sp.]